MVATTWSVTLRLLEFLVGVNMARNFEESNNDYIEVGDVAALDLTGDEVTLSAWVRLEALDGEQKVFAKWADAGGQFQYLLSINGSDQIIFAINAGGQSIATGATTMIAGTWCHVAGTYDGSNMRVYLIGVEDGSTAKTGNMSNTTAPVRIGAGSGGSGTEEPFDGDIGHCAIWDTPLSASEIKSLSVGINPRNIHRENLLFYSPLNGQDPEYDVVGGLDLTVNGPTKSEEPPIPNSIVAP